MTNKHNNITVQCNFGIGIGTPDLQIDVIINAGSGYPDAIGQMTGEIGRVKQALKEALKEVEKAEAKYKPFAEPVYPTEHTIKND